MFRLYCLGFLVGMSTASVFAQESKESAGQKKIAEENMKLAVSGTAVHIETKNLLVYSNVAEAKLRPIAEACQKTYDYAFSFLKFDSKESPWTGKLTVYYLPDRRDYIAFSRLLETTRPDRMAYTSTNLRGNEPYITVAQNPALAVKDYVPSLEVARGVAAALLDRKAGAHTRTFNLPNWLRDGFGRIMVYRALGTQSWNGYKAKLKKVFSRANLGAFSADKVMSAEVVPMRELLEASLVEYLALGLAAKFPKFLSSLRPGENETTVNLKAAWETSEIDPKSLDASWKRWVISGK